MKPSSGIAVVVCGLISLASTTTMAQEWELVTDTDQLRQLVSDTQLVSTLEPGVEATATYNADGTGELNA